MPNVATVLSYLSILLYNNSQNYENHYDKKLQLVNFKHLTAGINFVPTVMKIIMVLWQKLQLIHLNIWHLVHLVSIVYANIVYFVARKINAA